MVELEKATFGAGCFWHVEHAFGQVKGVKSTSVGYMGGSLKNPTYHDVCTDKTGHAEVVQVIFDPKIASYRSLLDLFWKIHDPTTPNRQGPDLGTQYRSAIFYHNLKQKEQSLQSKRDAQEKFLNKIVTEIKKASDFYIAEEYHQKYFEKGNFRCNI